MKAPLTTVMQGKNMVIVPATEAKRYDRVATFNLVINHKGEFVPAGDFCSVRFPQTHHAYQ